MCLDTPPQLKNISIIINDVMFKFDPKGPLVCHVCYLATFKRRQGQPISVTAESGQLSH